ncbi:hypothetical protein [Curtobacterium sp. BH-2-1-1]|uniref:hypothetical protein n=1 Tax=Curtobacterium sp. BH-2-1-1 TaxID=1905847 RepID=UPI001642F3E5|nr:hypothetical protein [Curtobacterium sp. BH-2-1-1]
MRPMKTWVRTAALPVRQTAQCEEHLTVPLDEAEERGEPVLPHRSDERIDK